MGSVDMFDQLLAVYSISWKSRRWWLKIFYYLLDCCIVNIINIIVNVTFVINIIKTVKKKNV